MTTPNRLGSGHWNRAALTPTALNAQAAALGPDYNIFSTGGSVSPAAPAFLRYQPPAELRPFNLPAW